MAIRLSRGDRTFYTVVYVVMAVAFVVTLYPILYVLSMSLSAPEYVYRLEVVLFPKGFSLGSYRYLFENGTIFQYYGNTIIYTVLGTIFSMVLTVMGGYVVAQRHFSGRGPIMALFMVTMFFSGGMIPSFLLVRNLGMYDTRWAMIIPGAVGTYYIILARTFFMSLPQSLFEAARIDGADDLQILWYLVLPLSLPIISVLILYYAVGKWNSYFNALLYVPSKRLQPLQLYLVNLLVQDSADISQAVGSDELNERGMTMLQLKYTAIIVSIFPIMCVYPFLQKYFVKGVMIGAIKE